MRIQGYLRPILLTIVSSLSTLLVSSTIWAHSSCIEVFDQEIEALLFERAGRYEGHPKPPKKMSFEAPPTVSVSRFFGQDFQSRTSRTWDQVDGLFVQGEKSQRQQIGYRADESILADMQDFSLQKMVETGYLEPKQAEYFRRLGMNLEPGQIQFAEVVHRATPAELKEFYEGSPGHRAWEASAKDNGGPYVKTAAMWSVAGQVWDASGRPRKIKLPWEKEEARKGQELDRTEVEFVWEWGRAAQDVSGEMATLYALKAMVNYMELRAFGGNLDNAYIMVHSFDKTNSRLFERQHRGSLYPKDWKNLDDALFLIPLRAALEKYKPSTYSKRVADLIELSGGKLSDIEALDLLVSNKWARWHELTYKAKGVEQDSPIIHNDLSVNYLMTMNLILHRSQLDAGQRDAVMHYLVGINPTLHSINIGGKYNNASDSILTGQIYKSRNAVEISNLDPKLALRDPDYVLKVIYASMVYHARLLAHGLQMTYGLKWDQAYQEAIKVMQEKNIEFGVSTSDPLIAKYLERLHPEYSTRTGEPELAGPVRWDDPSVMMTPWWYKSHRMHFFSIQRILNLIQMRPDLSHDPEVAEAITPGVWQTQYLLNQTDLF